MHGGSNKRIWNILCVSCYNTKLNGLLDIKASISALFSLFSPPIKTELIARLQSTRLPMNISRELVI